MARTGSGVAVYVEGKPATVGIVTLAREGELIDCVVLADARGKMALLTMVGPIGNVLPQASPVASYGPLSAELAANAQPLDGG